ncbi:MAG: imidazole glycerol phosphate synthase subunit HisF [Myxococcales bacterium]|nr:imidazole glycerol phosphate synthase subunit HisF [Myxococcales bacterium]
MLTHRVIPCLDVKGGRVVKGVRFQGLRDAGDPVERALAYQQQGADEIVVLDVSATVEARSHQTEVIAGIRAGLMLPLTAGGGVRVADDAARLLEHGADKVAVNTAAVARPELIDELAARFGSQCTVVSIDARFLHEDTTGASGCASGAGAGAPGDWEVVVRAGREGLGRARSAVAWAHEVVERGAGEILLTSWDRDGTGVGYDLDLIRAVSAVADVPIIASGGAREVSHLAEAFEAGADAVLAATIFHDDERTVSEIKQRLAEQGFAMRLE